MPQCIKEKLQTLGYEAEHLDDLVTQAAQQSASNINNGGMSDQLHYLKQQGYTDETITQMLEDAD